MDKMKKKIWEAHFILAEMDGMINKIRADLIIMRKMANRGNSKELVSRITKIEEDLKKWDGIE